MTRVKYRGIAVADTARERPVLTVQLLDKQQRLTVSSIEDKHRALLAGLGVASMPYPMVEKDIAEGRLRVVSRNIRGKWRLSWHGGATAWAKRKPGACGKFPNCWRNVRHKKGGLGAAFISGCRETHIAAVRLIPVKRRADGNHAGRVDGFVAAIVVMADMRQIHRFSQPRI